MDDHILGVGSEETKTSSLEHAPDQLAEQPASPPRVRGVLLGLAELDPKAMVDQAALAELLGVSSRTIRQMVKRFEIPPPIRLNSRSVWFVGKVLEHLEARAKLAQDKADKEAKKYKTDFF